MTRIWIGATFATLMFLTALDAAAVDPRCVVPEGLVYTDGELANTKSALVGKREIRILSLGTSSSAGSGVSQPSNAYPMQLEMGLQRLFPGVRIVIINKAERGATAEKMFGRLEREVIPERPTLVIWQTGTVDAVQSVDSDAFGDIITRGVQSLKKAGADVVLMDMQYSPTSTTLMNIGPYKDQMHWVAQEEDVVIFRRYDIMVRLSRDGTVNLSSPDQKVQKKSADLVHLCLGELLADMIVRATGIEPAAHSKR